MKALEDSLPCAPDNAREILGLVSWSIHKRKLDRIGEELDSMCGIDVRKLSFLGVIGYCNTCGEYISTRTVVCSMCFGMFVHDTRPPVYSAKIHERVSIGDCIRSARSKFSCELVHIQEKTG